MAETPYKAPQDNEPEAVVQGPSSRVTLSVVSLAALAIIGAATANFLPHPDRLSLPTFDSISLPSLSLPKFDRIALPGFKSTSASSPAAPPPPAPARIVAVSPPAPPKPAALPLPDLIVNAALRDIQSSQKDIQSAQAQNATSLVLLRDSSATQQTELKRISRQLTALTAQVDALHGSMATLTTGSITPTSNIAHSNPRARLTRGSKRVSLPPPPVPEPPSTKPVGPVSVGGAPLGPAPIRSGV